MTNRERIETMVTELAQPIVNELGVEIWDVEYVKELNQFYLRIYIDKEGGVNILDCENVSRAIDALLEEKDLIKEAYIFEVSSPGLDRPLKKDNDYARSIGKEVEFKLYKAVDGQKEFVGTLQAYTKETVDVLIDNETKTFERKSLALIRLYVSF